MSTRKELEKILQEGRSVFYKGVHYTAVGQLPSEAELAVGDEKQEAEARSSIKAELRRLADQLAMLESSKTAQATVADNKEADKPTSKTTEKSKDDEDKPVAQKTTLKDDDNETVNKIASKDDGKK